MQPSEPTSGAGYQPAFPENHLADSEPQTMDASVLPDATPEYRPDDSVQATPECDSGLQVPTPMDAPVLPDATPEYRPDDSVQATPECESGLQVPTPKDAPVLPVAAAEFELQGGTQEPEAHSNESLPDGAVFSSPAVDEGSLEFAAPTPEPPVSTADVLKRMGATLESTDEEEPAQPFAGLGRSSAAATDELKPSESSPSWSAQPKLPPASATESSTEDEESIENYMSRLMERVRGGNPNDDEILQPRAKVTSPIMEMPPPEATSEMASDLSAKLPLGASPEPPAAEVRVDPRSMAPRSSAPERDMDLAAMRALANDSARSAIVISEQKRWSSRALGKTIVMFLLIVLGFMLHLVSTEYSSPIFLCSVACYGLAMYFFMQIGQIMKQVAKISKAQQTVPTQPNQGEASRPQ